MLSDLMVTFVLVFRSKKGQCTLVLYGDAEGRRGGNVLLLSYVITLSIIGWTLVVEPPNSCTVALGTIAIFSFF